MNEFEFDDDKSRANLQKHGIDFHVAKELWKDPDLLEIQAKSGSERRFLLIGRIGAKHWSAIVTYRDRISTLDFSQAVAQERGRAI
jgi:uncharacterized DUF497 family protein